LRLWIDLLRCLICPETTKIKSGDYWMYKNSTGNLSKLVEQWRSVASCVAVTSSAWVQAPLLIKCWDLMDLEQCFLLFLQMLAVKFTVTCKDIKIHLQSFDSLSFLSTYLFFLFDSPLYKFWHRWREFCHSAGWSCWSSRLR